MKTRLLLERPALMRPAIKRRMLTRWMTALFAAVPIAAALGGCEDAPPNDYVPQYVVQSFLMVDQPIRDLVISRSQPVTDTFKVVRGVVPDADVRIIEGDRTLRLVYHAAENGLGSYAYPDTTELVKPNTLYKLEIHTTDGGTITAQTMTAGRFAWTKAPRDTVRMPKRSDPAFLSPPDSLDLKWNNTSGIEEFLISVRSLDTLGYGTYLTPPTNDSNRRVNPDFDEQDQLHYTDLSRWGFVASTQTPLVWGAFKWYGRNVVTVYAADASFVNWFKMTYWTGNPQFDPLLGNVHGNGIGVFGSAAIISQQVFVLTEGG